MSTDVQDLPADAESLQAIVREQTKTIEELRSDYAQLKAYVERLERDRFGPRSERIDPEQLSLFLAEAGLETQTAPPEPPPTVVKQHVRREPRSEKLPDNLPREQVDHDLSETEKSCPCCGEVRERIGSETSERLEFIPPKLKVLEHVRYKYACKRCQGYVAIAQAPAMPIAKGLPGPGLLSHLIMSKYAEHMPLYRLEDEMARYGVEISRGTMCRWMKQSAGLLAPVYRAMVSRVRSSAVIHTDDTPVAVLDPSLHKTRTGRIWTYVGDADHPYSAYHYTPSRKRDGPAGFLKDFRGYLQADAYGGYDGIYATRDIKQVSCWAHARRKFFDARTSQSKEAHVALGYIARLYEVEREANALAADAAPANAATRSKWYEDRLALRKERSLPVLVDLKVWMEKSTVLPKSPVGQGINYVLPRWASFVRYCEDGRLAIDNNLSERTLRPCAIGRKNWLFLGNDDAGKTASIFFSLMASAKRNSIEPWAYLKDLFEKLSAAGDEPPAETVAALLPDAWIASHPESYRRYSR